MSRFFFRVQLRVEHVKYFLVINLFDRVDPMPVPASLRKALATCDFPGGGGGRLTNDVFLHFCSNTNTRPVLCSAYCIKWFTYEACIGGGGGGVPESYISGSKQESIPYPFK